jgi:hypothetical protein
MIYIFNGVTGDKIQQPDASFEAFTTVMFQVKVVRIVTLCSVVVGTHVSEVHAAFIFEVKC